MRPWLLSALNWTCDIILFSASCLRLKFHNPWEPQQGINNRGKNERVAFNSPHLVQAPRALSFLPPNRSSIDQIILEGYIFLDPDAFTSYNNLQTTQQSSRLCVREDLKILFLVDQFPFKTLRDFH